MSKTRFRTHPGGLRAKKLTGLDAMMAVAPQFAKPLKAALGALDRGDLLESLRYFAVCAEIDPTNKALLHFGAQPLERAYFGLKQAENPPPEDQLLKWRDFAYTILVAATEAFPDDPVALHNVGRFVQDEGDDQGSIEWYRKALRIKQDQVESWGNLGTAHYTLGDVDRAEQFWSRCVAFDAENASGKLAQAYIWLRRGDTMRGWPALNTRWDDQTFGLTYGRKDLTGKPWTGQPLRRGDSVLVHGEQGLGDHVQFARYIPLMVERGIAVAGLETRGPLLRWFRECLSVPVVEREKDPLPKYTHHVPLMSLPGILQCWEPPAPIAPPVDRCRLEGPRRIGLVWAGTRGNTADAHRSIEASELRHLADLPGVRWVSLQYDPSGSADITARAWLGEGVETTEYRDVYELAQVMASLDAVVTVDTLACHVAGSIGVPCYVLHRFNREWRWQQHSERTDWYPSHQMLTCPRPGAWTDLLRSVRDRLSAHQ